MTVLAPVKERGFAIRLSITGGAAAALTWGLRGCWDSTWHEMCIRDRVEGVPAKIKEGVSKEEAESIKEKLTAVGATIEIK